MDSFRYLPPALVAVSACLALASALPSEYTVHTVSVSSYKPFVNCQLSALNTLSAVRSPLCGGVMQIKLLRLITMIMMAALHQRCHRKRAPVC